MSTAATATGLDGKVAVVTGGANGIGRATAGMLAAEGAAVAVVDLIADLADEVAEQLRGSGYRALAIQADVADPADARRVVETTVREFGGLQILINNAGVTGGGPVPTEQLPGERWARTMDVNLNAQLRLAQAAFPWLAKQGGAIVCTASSAGVIPLPLSADYSISKAAIIALVQQLAAEWGGHGIRVNSVSPGQIETGFGRPRARGQERPPRDPALLRQREQWIPLGRTGQAEDVAKVIVFLASDQSGYVSGVNIMVDGGERTSVKNALRASSGSTRP